MATVRLLRMTERSVRRELVVDAPPDDVWLALTGEDELARWFGARVAVQLRRGGPVEARWPNGSARRGTVETVEPGRRLAFRWRSIDRAGEGFRIGDVSRVEFVLEPVKGGTRLRVVEELGIVPREASGAPR
jgi:uncharacterized protein YndB with AHSA1/START domain